MLRARVVNHRNEQLPSNSSSLAVPSSSLDDENDSVPKHRSRLRKRKGSLLDVREPSPFLLIIMCLCFAVSLELGYMLSLGAFSDGEFWMFYFGSSERNPTKLSADNSDTKHYKFRVLGSATPIDNYYSKPHIRDPVPLIVGGSDGSGTRAFVELLLKLNVPMLVEDRGTMDVHGVEIYNGAGWPALVTKVFNATQSASYNLEDLPEPLLQSAKEEVRKFLKSMNAAGHAMVGAGVGTTWANAVSWGFKAPASILLLPFFRDQLPAMKVLHIVRDGRDVALSENHSPVQKFYEYFYVDAAERHKALLEQEEFGKDARTNIKAMQLWNDWNKQVYEYGVRYSDGVKLDVLVMRTEDLMHYPLESVALLADFVGSSKSSQQLFCLSRMSGNDLGQSLLDPFEDRHEAGDVGDEINLRFPQKVDPSDFDQIRKRFAEFASDKDNKHGRRLAESQGKKDDDDEEGNLFKTGGRVASANQAGNGLNVEAAANVQQNGPMGKNSAGLSQVALMKQLLQERRASAQKTAKMRQTPEEVKLRYGKWASLLKTDPTLYQRLYQEGQKALSIFGYEPAREFMDLHPHPDLFDACDRSVVCK